MAKPVPAGIRAAFPDHVACPTLHDLHTHLGGVAAHNIETPGFGPTGNTCANRLSMAFNAGGAPITAAARAPGRLGPPMARASSFA